MQHREATLPTHLQNFTATPQVAYFSVPHTPSDSHPESTRESLEPFRFHFLFFFKPPPRKWHVTHSVLFTTPPPLLPPSCCDDE